MEEIMNYKRLFFGYVAFNFICGAVLGMLNSKMQEVYEHYINQARNKYGHDHKKEVA
jgi:hypothetical protein